jgi:hypothetical protein
MKYTILLLLIVCKSLTINAQYAGIAVYDPYGLCLLGTDHRITIVNKDFTIWEEHPGNGLGIAISESNSGLLLVGMDNHFFTSTGKGWESFKIGGSGKVVIHDLFWNGCFFCIGDDDNIWYVPNGNEWSLQTNKDFHVTDIVALNNTLYCIGKDDNKIYRQKNIYFPFNIDWVGNGLGKRVTIDRVTKALWCIGMDDDIMKFDGKKWVAYPGNGKGKEIAVFKDIPYVIAKDGSFWKGTGSGWVKLVRPEKNIPNPEKGSSQNRVPVQKPELKKESAVKN